jgi:S-adenosylmethionine:tRNA ribosyltransferase-isomerase
MHPRHIHITDYTYTLPEERIALYPLPERDQSKLLLYKKGEISEDVYKNLAAHLPQDTLLVCNDTRVMPARLLFQKPTGGQIEIFCLEPVTASGDMTMAMQQTAAAQWKCLVGGAAKWKSGIVLEKKLLQTTSTPVSLQATMLQKNDDSYTIEISWSPAAMTFAEIVHAAGEIPLPPYLHRAAEASDSERYQTIYAAQEGSVAAPTAGLHFTNEIFAALDAKNIQREFVTLHVGAGTFKPVKSDTLQGHDMHAEYMDVTLERIKNIHRHLAGTIVSVGTTSMRTLESLYLMGCKIAATPQITISQLPIRQWEVYDAGFPLIPVSTAFEYLINWMEQQDLQRLVVPTQLLMAPGYRPMVAHGLITNFHQPQSTLLLLVAAFIGADWRKAYAYALTNDFRFLSYGDGNLLWRNC